MPITNREVPQVVVNKLTQAQYNAATKVQDEFYLITDAPNPTVVQTTGQSMTDVMSQKAVTDLIGNVETILQTLNSGNGAQ